MSTHDDPLHDDPLWSAGPHGDAELARLERLLEGYRHVPATRRWSAGDRPRRSRRMALASGVAVLGLLAAAGGWFGWRLQWQEGAAWTVSRTELAGGRLHVGGSLATDAAGQARVRVARIGALEVSPRTRLVLLETRMGEHRVALEAGHVHARIWAPPGWFGVRVDAAEVIDLGCEFDLWRKADGSGRASVQRGWILHSHAGQDTLVPAGHTIDFDAMRAGIPRRDDADPAFGAAVIRLDQALAGGGADRQSEREVATRAVPSDVYTLLTLMTRHPVLASGPLYPRLASMLGVPADDARHREAWSQGSTHAINDWWERVPRPPKQWWRYWRDAV